MCKEVYANFELAKLLYEKGFDWESNPFEDWQDRDVWVQQYHIEKPNPDYDPDIPFSSATITDGLPHVSLAVVMKWLREVHGLFIEINCGDYANGEIWYNFDVINVTKEYVPTVPMDGIIEKNTYEEAVEEAIKFCLTKLIK